MFGRRKSKRSKRKSLIDVVSHNMTHGKPGPRVNVKRQLYPIVHSSQN